MFDNQLGNETTIPSSKDLSNFSNKDSMIPMNKYISVEQSEIEYYLSQIQINPAENIAKLLEISNNQYININKQFIPDIMAVLSSAFASDENDQEMIVLRKSIFQLLKNISDKFDKDDRSFCNDLSNPTYLSLLWKDFPNNYYSAQLLAKIVYKNPTAAEYIIKHEISPQQIQFLMSPDNSIDVIENVLMFFSFAFSSIDQYIPNLMDLFVDFTCNLITNCLSNDSLDDLLDMAEKSLKKMAKRFEEVSTKIIPFLPIICNFDEYDSITNMNINSLLKACVKKLDTYEILLAVDPAKVIYFINRCFDKSDDVNDCSLFSVLKLLTAVENLSPFDQNPELAVTLFEKLVSVINRNEKYELKENAVLIVCRLIKYANESEVEIFLKNIDFSFIFEFAEQDNQNIQIAILEAIINIDSFRTKESENGSSEFILNLLFDEAKMKIMSDLSESKNKEIAHYANIIIEKANF